MASGPLIRAIAGLYAASLPVVQWSLTRPLLAGTAATRVRSRLGDGPHPRVLGALPRSDASSAMSLHQVMRSAGSAVGSALAAAIIQATTDGR